MPEQDISLGRMDRDASRPRGDGGAARILAEELKTRRSRDPVRRPRRRQDDASPAPSCAFSPASRSWRSRAPPSPWMQVYDGPRSPIVHADFYRLSGGYELVRARLGRDDGSCHRARRMAGARRRALKRRSRHPPRSSRPRGRARARLPCSPARAPSPPRLQRMKAYRHLVERAAAGRRRAPPP